jgi:hypothetical protein
MLNFIILFVRELTLTPEVHYCIPIAIPIIAAALAVGAAANKWNTGRKQGNQADALGRTKRPFQTPEKEYFENVNMARNMVGMGLPGEGFLRNRNDRILSGGANKVVQAGGSSTDILGTISSLSGQQMDKEAETTYKGVEYRDKATGLLMNTKLQLAGEKGKAWDWNAKQPYLDAMAASSALKNASMLNKQNAFESLAKVPWFFAGAGKGAAGAGGGQGINTGAMRGFGGMGGSDNASLETGWGGGQREQKNYANFLKQTKYLTFEEYMNAPN